MGMTKAGQNQSTANIDREKEMSQGECHRDLMLSEFFEARDQSLTDLYTSLLASQECRSSEIHAKLAMEKAELRSKISGLCDHLDFSHSELESIKEAVEMQWLALNSVVAGVLDDPRERSICAR